MADKKRVPVVLLLAATLPRGQRLPKREHFHVAIPLGYGAGYVRNSGSRDDWRTDRTVYFLPESDYRIWEGNNYSSGSRCRACGESCGTAHFRQEHLRKSMCKEFLSAAYHLLRKTGKCCVCDKHACNTKWGVPFCSDGCVKVFKTWTPRKVTEAVVKARAS